MVYAGRDPLTGKARQVRETHKTWPEAEKALTRLQGQVDEDQQKSNITVRQAVEQCVDGDAFVFPPAPDGTTPYARATSASATAGSRSG